MLKWMMVLVCLTISVSRGGSIFDDDYAVPPESKPAKPAPEAQPRPASQARPDHHADPAPSSPAPSNPNPTDQPGSQSSPAPGPDDQLNASIATANEAFDKAGRAVEAKLKKDPSYTAAESRAKADPKPDSSAAVQVQKLRDAAFAKDEEYVNSKRYVTMLTRLSRQFTADGHALPDPLKPKEAFLDEIGDAVVKHGLIEGMTFQEACKSARKPVKLVSKTGVTNVYHWILKGSTGSYQQVHRDFRGGVHYETVPTYGVIGYVEGVFEDDYLVSFSRGK